jgi:hypothetical protein
MAQEVWRSHKQFPRYEVSNQGRVRNLHAGPRYPVGYIHVGQIDHYGYPVVLLRINGKRKMVKIHRMVVTAFTGEIPPERQANHVNGIKTDNRVENLEIVTPSENIQHTFDVLGRVGAQTNPSRGERHGNARWKDQQIRDMRALYAQGTTQKDIAKRFKAARATVYYIVNRKTWAHVK